MTKPEIEVSILEELANLKPVPIFNWKIFITGKLNPVKFNRLTPYTTSSKRQPLPTPQNEPNHSFG